MAGRDIIVVSACLLGEHTRYDGKPKADPLVCEIAKHFKVIKICPEVALGFPVPRPRVFLYKTPEGDIRIMQEGTQRDITEEVRTFCENFLKGLPSDIKAFILKSKSPSCSPSPTTKYYIDLEGKNLEGRTYGILGKLVPKFFSNSIITDELSLKEHLSELLKF